MESSLAGTEMLTTANSTSTLMIHKSLESKLLALPSISGHTYCKHRDSAEMKGMAAGENSLQLLQSALKRTHQSGLQYKILDEAMLSANSFNNRRNGQRWERGGGLRQMLYDPSHS